ncbi:hypothetical protein BC832DRAFT_566813, partial [Gaertneriomyces semiglobifer]
EVSGLINKASGKQTWILHAHARRFQVLPTQGERRRFSTTVPEASWSYSVQMRIRGR